MNEPAVLVLQFPLSGCGRAILYTVLLLRPITKKEYSSINV